MAELPAAAPMPAVEKPPDAPATTLPKKKASPSSKDKKRKEKPPSEPPLAVEAPVAKKLKPPSDPASAAEAPVAKKSKPPSDPPPAAAEAPVAKKPRPPSYPTPAAEVPVSKKPNTVDTRTSAAETCRSGVVAHGDDVTPAGIPHSWSDWSAHTSAKNQVNNEYDRYLRDDLFPCNDKSFDILNWWKMHASKYPTLAVMVRDILAATASTVPSESAFSTSGRVINDHRTRLAGSTVEALLCHQDWLRSAGSSYLDIISIDSLSEDNVDGW